MDFSFNEGQCLIAETAEAFLSDVSSSDSVRSAMAAEQGFDPALWLRVTQDMGWQLTHIPKQFEGLGLGYVELCILLERMGQNLFCSPFFSNSCLGINALLVAGTKQQRHSLKQIASDEARYTLAYCDADGQQLGVKYRVNNDGAVLNGTCHYVVDGHTADTLIVAAEQGEGQVTLFVVPADTQGVKRRYTPSLDQTRKLAQITFENVQLELEAMMCDVGEAMPLLEDILSLACISIAAEQLGVADRSLAMTVEYVSERRQFGRAVGSFQSMKHKAADMMNKTEAARSAVYYAACVADEYLQGNQMGMELHEAASIAKSYCCDAAFFNTGSAMQMHGGVGFTWEYDVHLYFKRAKSAQLSFRDSAWHRERIASLLLGETR